MNSYSSLEYNNTSNDNKIWYTNNRGCICKSWYDPKTNRIYEEKIPYNHPNNTLKFLDEYFRYKLN